MSAFPPDDVASRAATAMLHGESHAAVGVAQVVDFHGENPSMQTAVLGAANPKAYGASTVAVLCQQGRDGWGSERWRQVARCSFLFVVFGTKTNGNNCVVIIYNCIYIYIIVILCHKL